MPVICLKCLKCKWAFFALKRKSCYVKNVCLEHELNMDILFVVCGMTRISIEDYFFVMLYCDSWPLRKWELLLWFFGWSLHFAKDVWLFCEDTFIILWLGLFPSIFINVFLLICFCSVYVIRLFGRCSRVLNPALDSSPLNWDIISFTVNFHFKYHDHCLNGYLKQNSWVLLFSQLWLIIFYFPLF